MPKTIKPKTTPAERWLQDVYRKLEEADRLCDTSDKLHQLWRLQGYVSQMVKDFERSNPELFEKES